jgi:signal transduction histidine kinase
MAAFTLIMCATMESTSEELKRYARFTPADAELVASFAQHAAPHFPRIAGEFYERLLEHEDAYRVFEGDEQIARLKTSMVGWLARLFGGDYDDRYFEASKALGRLHVNIGLPSRYVSAGMLLLRSELTAVVSQRTARVDEAVRIVDALSRLMDIELALMLDSYHEHLASRVRTEQERRLSALGTLSAGLAHEIRNPLNGARLHVAFLERELTKHSSSELVDAVHVIDHEIDRLARLLSDFLDYAEPRPLVHGPISASTFIARCTALVQPSAAARNVSVQIDLPPADVIFQADATRLERVIINLLTNAIEALRPGGTARIRVRGEPTAVRFDVEDNGPGAAAGAPLFDPFYTTKHDGTGLGLSVAHRIVTDHGGTIEVDSRPGRTVFRVQLPTRRVLEQHTAHPPEGRSSRRDREP